MSEATDLSEASRPSLAVGSRLRFDQEQEQWLLSSAERDVELDDVALEIIKRCNGKTTLGDIVDDLAAQFSNDRDSILADVSALLRDLADQRLLSL